jgi:DNA repair protein RecO (recombination protein O)
MIENTSGIILRTRLLTETSLIVHWLSPDLGRIATVAKGARRSKSPFTGKLDIFYLLNFSFQRSTKSELHQLREVGLKGTHSKIREDMDRLHQASYAAALIEQSTETESPIPEIYSLYESFLSHLCSHVPVPRDMFAFEVKLLTELGYQPNPVAGEARADIGEILRVLMVGDWASTSRLKLSEVQSKSISDYLKGFIHYHLGRVPNSRKS